MIQSAMNGTFRADRFDESLFASVETQLSEYIAATEIQERKAVVEQEKTKTLIADISHQTKTPLANILLYAELLKEECGENSETIAMLEGQVKKLDFLIQSLVKLSRLETGILVLHPKKNKVSALLEEAQKQYAAAAKEKGLYLRVLSEEAQGVTVSVKQYELFVSIEVADTGIGIAEEEHAKIFGRFYRSEAVSGRQGVGIGLYLAREILRRQSGYMKLASEKGNGAVFSVYLPVP